MFWIEILHKGIKKAQRKPGDITNNVDETKIFRMRKEVNIDFFVLHRQNKKIKILKSEDENMKKVFALILGLAMILSLSAAAFADEPLKCYSFGVMNRAVKLTPFIMLLVLFSMLSKVLLFVNIV